MKSSTALMMFTLLLITQDTRGWIRGGLPPGCDPCICLKTTSQFIRPQWRARVQISAPRFCCQRTEIIVTLKNGKIVCVNPNAKWLNQDLVML